MLALRQRTASLLWHRRRNPTEWIRRHRGGTMTTLYRHGWMIARPADALEGKPLLRSLLVVLLVAAGWAVLMQSAWVGASSAGLALVPLWWTPRERETL